MHKKNLMIWGNIMKTILQIGEGRHNAKMFFNFETMTLKPEELVARVGTTPKFGLL